MKPLVILGIFDNDDERSLAFLKKEEEAIANALGQLSSRTEIIYYSHHNLGMEGMIKLITDYRDVINWFHFSGHHDKGKGIKLNDGNFEQLGNLLADCKNLKGVFLNGCTSKEALQTLVNKIPICIGTIQPVYDEVAMKFSELFYQELKTLTKWHDFSEIQDIYHRTNTSVFNLLKEAHITDTQRGAGSLEDFERNFYFISPISDVLRDQFNQREPSVHAYDMEVYMGKGGFPNFLEKTLGTNPKSYWKHPPLMLSNLLKPFLALDVRDEIKKFGEERNTAIIKYFYTYLDIARFAILSILWDEIQDKLLETPNNNIFNLFVPVEEYCENHIETLQLLCEVDIVKLGKRKELKFISLLTASLPLFKDGIALFENTTISQLNTDSFQWKAEQFLQRLIVRSKFLNGYRIRSVHSKFYMKHRNDLQHKFEVEYVLPDGTSIKEDETKSGYEFANVHSVYLCERHETKEIVINLSPFYFDYNSYDAHARKIDLYVLDSFHDDDAKFEFKPLYDPLKSVQSESIAVRSHTSVDDSIESKNLFSQLDHFMSSLSVTK